MQQKWMQAAVKNQKEEEEKGFQIKLLPLASVSST